MNHLDYMTEGTCSRSITIDVDENGIIRDLSFFGGCNGNLKGICRLLKGMKAEDVIARLEGTICGFRNTSCPDQIAKNLKKALAEMN